MLFVIFVICNSVIALFRGTTVDNIRRLFIIKNMIESIIDSRLHGQIHTEYINIATTVTRRHDERHGNVRMCD